jgi:hypothetical protein
MEAGYSDTVCECEVPAEASIALLTFNRGECGVRELASVILVDGAPCFDTVPFMTSILDRLPTLSGDDRRAALVTAWELAVDPRVPATLGCKGLAVDAGPTDAMDGDDCTVQVFQRAAQCRSILSDRLAELTPLLLRDSREAGAAAALLSTLSGSAVPASRELRWAYERLGADASFRYTFLLAAAVLAGTTEVELPDLRDWFVASAASDDIPSRVSAAIGLRNLSWPTEPPEPVVAVLGDAAELAVVDMAPWRKHNDSVRLASTLLLDWQPAHLRALASAFTSKDPEIRESVVAEVWRGLCCWREGSDQLSSLLTVAVGDPAADVADAAIVRLAWAGGAEDARDALASALNGTERSRRGRAFALLALGRLGDERCLAALTAELRSPALVAAIGPAVAGMREFSNELLPAFADYLSLAPARRNDIRTASVLRTITGWPEASLLVDRLPVLIEQSSDEAALWLIGEIGPAAAACTAPVAALMDLSSDPILRAPAAWALWRLTGDAAAALAVLDAMLTGQPHERAEAALAVARFAGAAAGLVGRLADAARNQANHYVAAATAYALAAVGAIEAVDGAVIRTLLESRRHVDLALDTLERLSRVDDGLSQVVNEIAYGPQRFTWPTVSDNAVLDDDRYRAKAQRLLT